MVIKTYVIIRRMFLVSVVLAIAGFWMLTGCKPSESQTQEAPVRPVKIMVLEADKNVVPRSYPGEVRPVETVELAFQVSGPLIELPVLRGDRVQKDQLLARIDPRDFKNELDAAQAVLDEAKATLARYEQAAKTGAISQQQVAEQKARVDVAQADLNIKKKAYDDTFMKAPFAGRIAEKYVNNFQNVMAKEKILSLQNIDQIEVVFYVPEGDVVTARRENPGRFIVTSGSLPGREFNAELKEFATDADPATQTFKAKLVMPAPEDVNILPGMTVQVAWLAPTVDNEQVTEFRIPAQAVFSPLPDKQRVWLVDPSTMSVSQKEVILGELFGDDVMVTDGLAQGDMIAISGVHHLREGMRVRRMEPTSQETSQ